MKEGGKRLAEFIYATYPFFPCPGPPPPSYSHKQLHNTLAPYGGKSNRFIIWFAGLETFKEGAGEGLLPYGKGGEKWGSDRCCAGEGLREGEGAFSPAGPEIEEVGWGGGCLPLPPSSPTPPRYHYFYFLFYIYLSQKVNFFFVFFFGNRWGFAGGGGFENSGGFFLWIGGGG